MNGSSDNDNLIAIQWIPTKILAEDALTNLRCNPIECTPPGCHCKQPGCICQRDEVCGP